MNDFVGTQLRGWDAATFRTASGDPTLRSTVVALTILESAPEWARLRQRVERLTLFVPALRMRPLFGALGMSAPRLAVDPSFDMDVHLRRYRLPEGAGWRELLDDARRMSLTDFDHNRPLWEAALVEGLPGGQAAFLLKLHHSIADGQATVMMGLSLFEFGPEPDPNEAPAPPAPEAEEVGVRDVTYANLADTLRRGTDLAVATVRGALDLAKGTVTETRSTWEQAWNTMTSIGRVASVPDGPLSPVMLGRGTTYRFAAFELPFEGIRGASKAIGLNVNDAFMASIAMGMDRYHIRHGVVAEQLRVNVPISLRGDAGDRTAQASNSVSIARFPIPIAGLTRHRAHGRRSRAGRALEAGARHPAGGSAGRGELARAGPDARPGRPGLRRDHEQRPRTPDPALPGGGAHGGRLSARGHHRGCRQHHHGHVRRSGVHRGVGGRPGGLRSGRPGRGSARRLRGR